MVRLLRYIDEYQKKEGVAPTGMRAIGRAIGLGHAQVARLIKAAIRAGNLVKSGPDTALYTRILIPPTRCLARISVVECLWSKPIQWEAKAERAYWTDLDRYGMNDGEGLYFVTFPVGPPGGKTANWRLRSDVLVLVRRIKLEDLKDHGFYLVEYEEKVDAFKVVRDRYKRSLFCRAGYGEMTGIDHIPMGNVTGIAEILRMEKPMGI